MALHAAYIRPCPCGCTLPVTLGHALACLAAPGKLPPQPYEDNSGNSFQFVNSQLEADKNELECQKLCGHLASYDSLSQQSEVEVYYESAVGAVPGRAAVAHLARLWCRACWYRLVLTC